MFAFFNVFCQSQCKCGSLEAGFSKVHTGLIIGSDTRPPRNNGQGHSSSVLNTVANHPFPHKRRSDTVVPSTRNSMGLRGLSLVQNIFTSKLYLKFSYEEVPQECDAVDFV